MYFMNATTWKLGSRASCRAGLNIEQSLEEPSPQLQRHLESVQWALHEQSAGSTVHQRDTAIERLSEHQDVGVRRDQLYG